MSGFYVEFRIANDHDELAVKAGRRTVVRAGVGSGLVCPTALRLHLPRVAVVQLGLRVERDVFTRRKDGRTEQLDRAWGARIELCGRSSVFSAVVEPFATVATIGHMVLTDLDLVVDADGKTLRPRDPNTIITELA